MGVPTTPPDFYPLIAKCKLGYWDSTWAANDDVSQVHKNTSTDKKAYWKTANILKMTAPTFLWCIWSILAKVVLSKQTIHQWKAYLFSFQIMYVNLKI